MKLRVLALACGVAALGPQTAGRLAAGPHGELFYWLTPARSGDADAPLVVWLNGGPGASSMMGLFLENGPFVVRDDGSVAERNASWNNRYDMLWVDQPAGTGFSVATSPDGYAKSQDAVAAAFVEFMGNLYATYPNLKKKKLWLTGESYAGKYIPAIASTILATGADVPLAGVAIGNGLTRPREMTLSVPDSYYAVGILDAAQRDQAAELAAACVAHIDAGRWGNATAARSILFDYIDSANGGKKTAPNVDNFMFYGDYNETAVFRFLNSDSTKKLLNLPANASWQQSSDAVHDHLSDDIMKPYDHMINPILDAGLPTLLYQGQLDMRDGVAATEAWLANWTWMYKVGWTNAPRTAWVSPEGAIEPYDSTQPAIAGYVRSCTGLTHMTVGGAGHLVPHDQPDRALDMITRFIDGKIPERCR